jgi:hypothetical protein
MPSILAGARIGKTLGTRVGPTQRVIELAACQQPGIRGDRGATKLQQQTAVEIEPQSTFVRFTRRVPHHRPGQFPTRY